MNGTLSASSCSCFANRQERRLESLDCTRPDRRPSRQAFRKTCFSKKRAHLFGNTPLRAKSRTTTLGPFGEVIRATGPMAKANPIRFSTKYQDDESDLLYYGYRYYKPSTGNWLNQDPLGEAGFELARLQGNAFLRRIPHSQGFAGINLYGFVRNQPTLGYDIFGLEPGFPRGPDTLACIAAMDQLEAAFDAEADNPSPENIARAEACLAEAQLACAPPPPPPSWCPANRWVPPYIPPPTPQQQCFLAISGGTLVLVCIIVLSPIGL